MSTCWKCGKELPEGQTECEYGCGEVVSDRQVAEAFARLKQNTVSVDWDKVQSVEDVRAVFQALFGTRIHFPTGIPDAIKRFLKERGE